MGIGGGTGPNNQIIVVCVIGQPGSGKDTLANFLTGERNFYHISTGDIIREEMRSKNIPTNRENMRIFSAKRRKVEGNSYPANIAIGKILVDTVISGPRNLEEVKVLRKKFGKRFILVAVNAPIKVRYRRVINGRGRAGDNISFDDFKKQEEAECASGTHELIKLLSTADYTIDNSRTKQEMFSEMDTILNLILKK